MQVQKPNDCHSFILTCGVVSNAIGRNTEPTIDARIRSVDAMINSCKEEQKYRPNQHEDKCRHHRAQPKQYVEPLSKVWNVSEFMKEE